MDVSTSSHHSRTSQPANTTALPSHHVRKCILHQLHWLSRKVFHEDRGAYYEDQGAYYEDWGAYYEDWGAYYEDWGAYHEHWGAYHEDRGVYHKAGVPTIRLGCLP